MREIKFRIWDKENKKMWSPQPIGNIVENTDMGLPIYVGEWESGGRSIGSEESFVWLQFTGLKDGNGQEIYEGDIIAYSTRPLRPDGEYGSEHTNYEVFWPKSNALLRSSKKDFLLLSELHQYTIEVKGNIYENPELLNGN